MSDKKKKSVKGKNPKPYIPPTQEELDELGSFPIKKMEPAKPISEEDAKDLRKLRKELQQNFETGGMNNVPSKYKGFSNLPEGVQEKIDPKLAKKYKTGGMSKAVMKARGGTFKGIF